MKKLMWMVACALLFMALPMVQGCSDDDDDDQDNQSVPTTPEGILKFIQGDWRQEDSEEDMDEFNEKRVMRVTKDTVMMYVIDMDNQVTVYEESHIMFKAGEKLVFTLPQLNHAPVPAPASKAPVFEVEYDTVVVAVDNEGRMKHILKGREFVAHREKFDLLPPTKPCVQRVLSGRWIAKKLITGNVQVEFPANGENVYMVIYRNTINGGVDVKLFQGTDDGPYIETEKFKLAVDEDGKILLKSNDRDVLLIRTGINRMMLRDNTNAGNKMYLERDENFHGILGPANI